MKDNKNKKASHNTKTVVVEGIDVMKKYRSNELIVDVLKKVNITVREGEIISIIGPSGCGKTTLLNCLSGIDDIDNGEVYFLGQSIEEMSDDQKTKIRAKDMGFIFQSFNLIPVLTAVENVELPMLLLGKGAKESRKCAIELLTTLGLSHRLDNKPNQLSGGEKQRVAIARALINNPKVVWADEPTGNLDTKNSEEILKLIISLNKEKGTTFVIVTHDLNIASKTDRIIRMDSGEIKN